MTRYDELLHLQEEFKKLRLRQNALEKFVVNRMIPIHGADSSGLYFKPDVGAWTDMVLQNSWVNFDSAWEKPGYRKLNKTTVEFRGLIKGGITTSDTVLTNFPIGFRPSARVIITTISDDNMARIDIKINGDLVTRVGVLGSWLVVKGIFSII